MQFQIDLRNPVLIGLVFIALLGGGGWFAWKHPNRFQEIIHSSYDRNAIVNVEKMRAALDPDLLTFLRHELIKEAVATETIHERSVTMNTPLTITEVRARPVDYFRDAHAFATSRTDRRIRLHLHYTHPRGSGEATGEALITRANRWTLLSVELIREEIR